MAVASLMPERRSAIHSLQTNGGAALRRASNRIVPLTMRKSFQTCAWLSGLMESRGNGTTSVSAPDAAYGSR
jgi:hypothetical protein